MPGIIRHGFGRLPWHFLITSTLAILTISRSVPVQSMPQGPVTIRTTVETVRAWPDDVVSLSVEVISQIDLPAVTVRLGLSAGLSPAGGDFSWSGPLAAGTPVSMDALVRVLEPGYHSLLATAG